MHKNSGVPFQRHRLSTLNYSALPCFILLLFLPCEVMFLCILSVFILTIKTQKSRHHRQRIELTQLTRAVYLAHHERTLQTPLSPRRKHHHQ